MRDGTRNQLLLVSPRYSLATRSDSTHTPSCGLFGELVLHLTELQRAQIVVPGPGINRQQALDPTYPLFPLSGHA